MNHREWSRTKRVKRHNVPGHIHIPTLLDDGTYAYTWDGAGRLIAVEPKTPAASDKMVKYEYDFMGRRKRRTVYPRSGASWSGTPDADQVFVNHSMQCVEVLDNLNSDTPIRAYAWGLDVAGNLDMADSPFMSMAGAGGVGGLLCMVTAQSGVAGTYTYSYDGNGNVVKLFDSDVSTIDLYRYGPFGEDLSLTTPTVDNPYRFSTKFNETAMDSNNDGPPELYDYGFRWYHADLGRWTARDPIGEAGGDNLYFFVGNDAPNTVDIFGFKCYKLTHTIGIGGLRQNGIVGDDRGTDTHSAKGMGVGFYGEGEIDLSVEVCDCSCPNGKGGYDISGEVLASVRVGASLASYAFVADLTVPLGGGWSFTAGVNAWVGARVYGQIYGKAGVGISYSTCGGLPSVDFKLKVGGEFGVEFGGEATAYLKIKKGWVTIPKRLSVGIAGGGRVGLEWEPDVSCDFRTCTFFGPAHFYAEGYLRAVFLGFNAEFSVGGKKDLGNWTYVSGSPLNPLSLL